MKKLVVIIFLLSFCVVGAETTDTAPATKKVTREEKKKLKSAPAQKKSVPSSEKKPDTVKLPKSAYPIDRIEAVIFGSEMNDVVTLSDIKRVGFDGKFHTKDDIISDRLIFQDAVHYRIAMDEKAVDEYMMKVAKNTGGSIEDIKAMFAQAGYTYEEGRRQFAIMFANNQLIDHKIRARLIVPEHLVVEYYEANPITKPASYILERAFVPTTPQNSEEIKKDIEHVIKTGRGLVLTWYQLPELSQGDLAQDKQYITKLKVGEIGVPQEIDGGFELFRVKSKKPSLVVPLEERYRNMF